MSLFNKITNHSTLKINKYKFLFVKEINSPVRQVKVS